MKLDPHAKLLWQGDRVKNWLETGESVPVLVEIAPTGYCNAFCPWCGFRDKREAIRINSETMLRVLSEMAEFNVSAINWTGGGEPTIHPDFEKFVRFANRKGLKQGLFTNGFKEIPAQELFEWIRVSLTNEGYKSIVKPKVPFGICLNQIASQTESELRELCVRARDLGAVYFQIRPALACFGEVQAKLEVPEYLKEYEIDQFKVYVTPYKYEEYLLERTYDKCYGYFFCPSIDWRGQLGVCLYMMDDKKFVFGDLEKEKFSEIWNRLPNHIPVIPECQNCCKNHEINRILFAAKNIEQADFI